MDHAGSAESRRLAKLQIATGAMLSHASPCYAVPIRAVMCRDSWIFIDGLEDLGGSGECRDMP